MSKPDHGAPNPLARLDSSGILHTTFQTLGLKYEQFEEYNGSWFEVKRRNFDLFMLEEPYQSLVMLINISTQEYIFRFTINYFLMIVRKSSAKKLLR